MLPLRWVRVTPILKPKIEAIHCCSGDAACYPFNKTVLSDLIMSGASAKGSSTAAAGQGAKNSAAPETCRTCLGLLIFNDIMKKQGNACSWQLLI
jgi:hypothetical protein